MIEFAAEPYSETLLQEMMPLWQEHHRENRQIPGAILEPHLTMYQSLALAGVLRIWTARKEKYLVGYQVFTIMIHPHFMTKKQAVMDILYLAADERLGWIGVKFMKFVDDELIKEGVNFVFRSIDARKDFGPVLEFLGYNLCDLTFMRNF